MLFFGVSSVQFHLSIPRVVQKVAIYIYGWFVGNNTYPKWLQQLGVILIEVALKYYLFRYLVLKMMVKSPSISSCQDLCWLFVLFPISTVIKHPERGFSINKYLLAIYSASTSEKTSEAICLVKDYVILNVAEDNVPTRALLKKCTDSRQMELLKRWWWRMLIKLICWHS